MYDSLDLAPLTSQGSTVLVFTAILAVYWYLCWWVTLAAIFSIAGLVTAIYIIAKGLARLCSRRRDEEEPVRQNSVDISALERNARVEAARWRGDREPMGMLTLNETPYNPDLLF